MRIRKQPQLYTSPAAGSALMASQAAGSALLAILLLTLLLGILGTIAFFCLDDFFVQEKDAIQHFKAMSQLNMPSISNASSLSDSPSKIVLVPQRTSSWSTPTTAEQTLVSNPLKRRRLKKRGDSFSVVPSRPYTLSTNHWNQQQRNEIDSDWFVWRLSLILLLGTLSMGTAIVLGNQVVERWSWEDDEESKCGSYQSGYYSCGSDWTGDYFDKFDL